MADGHQKWAETWWQNQQVTKQYYQKLANKLYSYQHVVISEPPWPIVFRMKLADLMRNLGLSFFQINCKEAIADPDFTLLDCIVGSIGLTANYDGTPGSILTELNKARNICYFWNIPDEFNDELNQLAAFFKKCRTPISLLAIGDHEKLNEFSAEDFTFSNIDLFFFTWDILMQKGSKDFIEFKADLIHQFAHGDPQKIAICCNESDQCIYSPENICTWLNPKQIEQDQYKAQLEYLMPLLETARYNLCLYFQERIPSVKFPYHDEYASYNKATELEFRHWAHLNGEGKIQHVTSQENDCLMTLYNARNDLSHVKHLKPERIKEVLKQCQWLDERFE